MPDRGVLFDVDGTLVDSNYLHAVTWHAALRTFDHLVPTNVLHRAIGMGSDQMLDHVLGTERDTSEDEDISQAHKVLYRQHWERLTRLPGARELVRACADRGLAIVLASSADENELAALKRVLDADELITAETNADDVQDSKPEPDIVGVALERARLTADQALFVGDSVWDGIACERAGVAFIGLTCGGTSAHELRGVGAVEVWQHPADLLDHLADSRLGN